jgi:hypothetical protein
MVSPLERKELIELIEKASHKKEANSAHLVHMYEISIKDRPVFTLIQDINQRSSIYKNLLEQIKNAPNNIDIQSIDSFATDLKSRYESLGLIPIGNLPNPTASSICQYILDKISKFSVLIIDILAKHSSRISQELQIPPSLTLTFQVGVSWPPQVTLGIEKSGE